MDKRQYEKDLAERQRKHREGIEKSKMASDWQPCRHNECSQCVGTGVKSDGSKCIHFISCPCPKCTVIC